MYQRLAQNWYAEHIAPPKLNCEAFSNLASFVIFIKHYNIYPNSLWYFLGHR